MNKLQEDVAKSTADGFFVSMKSYQGVTT
jgi:hypothetical protein